MNGKVHIAELTGKLTIQFDYPHSRPPACRFKAARLLLLLLLPGCRQEALLPLPGAKRLLLLLRSCVGCAAA